jgi:hypothetical protein
MSSPSLSYLMLDSVNDPVLAGGTSLTNGAACAQAILTRLNLFFATWWENLNLGLPVFQQMLGQLGSARGIAAMNLVVQQNVEGAPYVTSVVCTTAFTNGRLTIQVQAQTVFGIVTVNYTPGLSASLGG